MYLIIIVDLTEATSNFLYHTPGALNKGIPHWHAEELRMRLMSEMQWQMTLFQTHEKSAEAEPRSEGWCPKFGRENQAPTRHCRSLEKVRVSAASDNFRTAKCTLADVFHKQNKKQKAQMLI